VFGSCCWFSCARLTHCQDDGDFSAFVKHPHPEVDVVLGHLDEGDEPHHMHSWIRLSEDVHLLGHGKLLR